MSAPVSIIVKTKEFSDMVTPVLRIFISGGSCHKNVHIYSLTQALCVALYLYYESLGAVINANVFFFLSSRESRIAARLGDQQLAERKSKEALSFARLGLAFPFVLLFFLGIYLVMQSAL